MNNWCSVKDNLPEEDDLYLVIAPSGNPDIPFRSIAWFDPDDNSWSMIPELWADKITHWMPFPTTLKRLKEKEVKIHPLYMWLSENFNDLDSAKIFYQRWVAKDQMTPFGDFTFREMAYQISMVLEGKMTEEDRDAADYESYTDTKYGTELYFCLE